MQCNGFNSDDYRYFYLEQSKDWAGFTNWSYGKLQENGIIKISKEDLKNRLFSDNYWNQIRPNIYEHEVVEYPSDQPFDLFEYISMQKAITFKWDEILTFHFDTGEYAIINQWLTQKMSSHTPLSRIFPEETIADKNKHVLNMVYEEERIKVKCLEDKARKELSLEIQPQAFKFKESTPFYLECHPGESWPLTDTSIFLSVFNQNFIRLLANSREILGKEKEEVFLREYQDNIPNTTRRYYQVKKRIHIDKVFRLMDEYSLENFGVGFDSLIVRANVVRVDTCSFNRNNFWEDGSVKYFYVEYKDNFNDRIAEKEIEKVAIRLPYEKAMQIEKENHIILKEKEDSQANAIYINKHKKQYEKFCKRNPQGTYEDFIQKERKELTLRLVKSLTNCSGKDNT